MQRVLTKREKTILYTTIGLIIFSLFFNFIIGPALKQNDTLSKEINITRVKLRKYLRLLSQKDSIEKKYNDVAANFDVSGQQGDLLVATLSELEGMAKAAGVMILDIRPQVSSRSSDLYKELTVDLRTEGNMEGYLKFIYNLENSLSLLRIKKFQLNSKSNSASLEGIFSISKISAP